MAQEVFQGFPNSVPSHREDTGVSANGLDNQEYSEPAPEAVPVNAAPLVINIPVKRFSFSPTPVKLIKASTQQQKKVVRRFSFKTGWANAP